VTACDEVHRFDWVVLTNLLKKVRLAWKSQSGDCQTGSDQDGVYPGPVLFSVVQRVAIGLGEFAEATAVSPTEVLVNGKAPGETTLIIWKTGGGPSVF
jgi:hypothetical protein